MQNNNREAVEVFFCFVWSEFWSLYHTDCPMKMSVVTWVDMASQVHVTHEVTGDVKGFHNPRMGQFAVDRSLWLCYRADC